MSIGAVFIGILLFGLTVYFLTAPWRRQTAWLTEMQAGNTNWGITPSHPAQTLLADLQARRDALYESLADLDFDRSAGKLNEEDYLLVRGELMAQAVSVLQQLDAEAADVENQIEALVQTRLAREPGISGTGRRQNVVPCPRCSAPARPGDRFCARCGSELDGICPSCGGAVRPGDGFCARCGSALAFEAAGA